MANYTANTIEEPMYMAARFFEWCQKFNADPADFDIGNWIND